jgi:molecular chaperone GrpE (heat shock protein)
MYRCVKMLRSSPRLTRLDTLREVTEWMFACFVAVLKLPGLSPLYPVGKSFDPREHEAVAVVANAMLPPGRVADVEQVGFLFAEKLLRPAVVIVVAPKTGTSSS